MISPISTDATERFWRQREVLPRMSVYVMVLAVAAGLGLLTFVLSFGSHSRSLHDEGIALIHSGEFGEAVDSLTEAVDREPDADLLASAYYNRSIAYSGVGQLEETVAEAPRAIELQPASAELLALARVKRARAFVALGMNEDAVADASAVIDLSPDRLDLLIDGYGPRSIAESNGRSDR